MRARKRVGFFFGCVLGGASLTYGGYFTSEANEPASPFPVYDPCGDPSVDADAKEKRGCDTGPPRRFVVPNCLRSPDEIGHACDAATGGQCVLLDHCPGLLPGSSAYRGYECVDGVWTDVTGSGPPCPIVDAGAPRTDAADASE